MTTKDVIKAIEDHIDQLATTASFTQDKEPVQQLRELLYIEAHSILKKRLTEKLANRYADKMLAALRKERRQRLQDTQKKVSISILGGVEACGDVRKE